MLPGDDGQRTLAAGREREKTADLHLLSRFGQARGRGEASQLHVVAHAVPGGGERSQEVAFVEHRIGFSRERIESLLRDTDRGRSTSVGDAPSGEARAPCPTLEAATEPAAAQDDLSRLRRPIRSFAGRASGWPGSCLVGLMSIASKHAVRSCGPVSGYISSHRMVEPPSVAGRQWIISQRRGGFQSCVMVALTAVGHCHPILRGRGAPITTRSGAPHDEYRSAWNVSTKKPRESLIRLGSKTTTPGSVVSNARILCHSAANVRLFIGVIVRYWQDW